MSSYHWVNLSGRFQAWQWYSSKKFFHLVMYSFYCAKKDWHEMMTDYFKMTTMGGEL